MAASISVARVHPDNHRLNALRVVPGIALLAAIGVWREGN